MNIDSIGQPGPIQKHEAVVLQWSRAHPKNLMQRSSPTVHEYGHMQAVSLNGRREDGGMSSHQDLYARFSRANQINQMSAQ